MSRGGPRDGLRAKAEREGGRGSRSFSYCCRHESMDFARCISRVKCSVENVFRADALLCHKFLTNPSRFQHVAVPIHQLSQMRNTLFNLLPFYVSYSYTIQPMHSTSRQFVTRHYSTSSLASGPFAHSAFSDPEFITATHVR